MEPKSVLAALSDSTVNLCATLHLWLPLLLLVLLVLPHLTFLLPDTVDHTDEVYQPLRALKFFKSAGQEFHKYGPMPNFILAVPFGGTLGYWWLTGAALRIRAKHFRTGCTIRCGSSARSSSKRVTMVLLGIVAFYILAREISLMTKRRLPVFLAMTFCIAANAVVVWKLPVPEVDSPMLAFVALALRFTFGFCGEG